MKNNNGQNIYLRLLCLLIFLAISFPKSSFSQQENSDASVNLYKNLYDNALIEVENLLTVQLPADSLIYLLIEDAQHFASQESWEDGFEILKTIIEIYGVNSTNIKSDEFNESADSKTLTPPNNNSSVPLYPEYPTFPFQLEVGVDYSLQEFELSFIENDSTIVEELQNPYVGFLFNHTHQLGNNSISFNHRFRLDDQFIYYSLFGTYQTNKLGSQNRLDFESYFYHQDSKENSDFFDNQLRYTFSRSEYGKNLFYINLRGRYKLYFQQDSLNNNLFSTALNSYYEHFFNFTNSLYFNVVPELYNEQQNFGLSYFQTRGSIFYRIRKNYNQYIEAGGEIIYRDYKDHFSDEYQNQYLSVEPRLEGELSFNSHWGIRFELELENRNNSTADEVNPNFVYFKGEGLLKYYWEDFKSIGAGYFYEQRTHSSDDDGITALVELEDFYSYGFVFNSEILNLSGLMLNLEYRLSLRNYPNSQGSLFYTYYSDRYVHSISAFGWIPIGNRWQVQLFANYDNDQDRENEQNDNRSTIFNVGLIYKF
jgi:hypothetical protein